MRRGGTWHLPPRLRVTACAGRTPAARCPACHFGESIYVIGFPGAVLWHDFLSPETRGAASVTFGRVSGFKLDVNERWVIQTDASISWGNSGGPAFNQIGEVIGLATFITTSIEGDQAIQGFNFLIPLQTIHQMAKDIGLTPKAEDQFTDEWERVITAYFQGKHAEALAYLESADKLFPGLWDVERLRFLLKDLLEFKQEYTPVQEKTDIKWRPGRLHHRAGHAGWRFARKDFRLAGRH